MSLITSLPKYPFFYKALFLVGVTLVSNVTLVSSTQAQAPVWSGYGGNAQHTANAPMGVTAQPLQGIVWQTPVDLIPQYSNNDLFIHYGSPMVTAANTILVPVKTGTTDGFRVEAHSGVDGSLLWQAASDYTLPTHNWIPSYSPAITPSGRLYMPGAGGTIYYRDNIDSASVTAPTQLAFYGNANYTAANQSILNTGVQICTPLTSDASGNVYFGYRADGTNPLGLNLGSGGVARIGADGSTTYMSATSVLGGSATNAANVVMNCAPALSNDGSTVYIAMRDGTGSSSLVALNGTNLVKTASATLLDPRTGGGASVLDDGTASPMVAPDGKVFFGVHDALSKGWTLQFTAGLTPTGTPGAFGWDDTPTVIPASAVPSYSGTSPYLLMTKYNNYAGTGGDGINKVAILDPNDTQVVNRLGTNVTVMKEVLTIAGVTPDSEYIANHPDAVREWCINTAVFDVGSGSVYVNSEDGKLYKWDLSTNSFTEQVTLTPGVGEAYTPTLIGADGKIYAINNATLFAIGAVPEPSVLVLLLEGVLSSSILCRRKSCSKSHKKGESES